MKKDRTNRVGGAATLAFMVALFTGPAAAQSTEPAPPNAPTEGHYHRGELGDKLLILEQSIRCNCGCGLDVHSCQFQMQCGTSPVWSKRMRESLAAGESVDAIQASFVADFGKTVLMSPPPEGFNLVGYLLPSVAIVLAGMLVGLLVRSGGRGERLAPVEQLSDEDAERLQAAMRQLDEEESPDW
jgi:cytochrome c-type biogenesis protein CcmH/NrfF